ncbi:MAG: 2-oxo acid dehydrogenase subunit E2 [Lachnospiraceae bacterium]|nr:2-oxo acid dehydrogenase subunit E2 [Lachnospiraceae bacterium]
MSMEIVMPKTGLTNTENTLDQWTVKEGDTVAKGQQIAEIESEKTTMPFESPAAGMIHLIAKEGDTVEVGGVIAMLAENLAEYDTIKTAAAPAAPAAAPAETAAAPAAAPAPAASAAPAPAPAPAAAPVSTGRVIASPLARKLAAAKGIDLHLLTGTGPKGRIVAKDVESYVPAAAPAAAAVAANREPVHIPLTPIRKAIAKNMFNSLHSMAQTSDSVEIDVTELVQMRNRLKDKAEMLGTKITVNDMLSYAAVKMLKTHPLANASYADTEIIQYPNVNLSMAVATNYGLVSPVVKDADLMSLVELSKALKDIVTRARDRKLTGADQTGATFTITNMGVFPVDNFNPILPSPQSCIMGFGRCVDKPAVYKGEICIRTMMVLSITYDHRVFDGGELGSIMTTMKEYLENPELFLVQ